MKNIIKRLLPNFIKENPFFIRFRRWIFPPRRDPSMVRRKWRPLQQRYGPMYWQKRKNLRYYHAAVEFARKYEPTAGQVIDIGSNVTEVVNRLSWIPRKVVLDVLEIPPRPGVEIIRADFLSYAPDMHYDLVLCLEVLEHQEDPALFAKKLLALGRTVVLSVPYRRPKGEVRSHIQDPVDEAKLKSWLGCDPIESVVVTDNRRFWMVAVYRQTP